MVIVYNKIIKYFTSKIPQKGVRLIYPKTAVTENSSFSYMVPTPVLYERPNELPYPVPTPSSLLSLAQSN